jgi:large subunit ribosomal protein L4
MALLKLYRFGDDSVGTLEVDTTVFGRRSPRRVQREAVLMYQANRRAGTHSTLDRSDVNGSKRKPWRQKHTGRARSGDKQSPLWRGGGVIHGPHPRDYSYSVPRKALRAATRAALAGKFKDDEVVFVDDFAFDRPSTRRAARMLAALGVERRFLCVLPAADDNAWKSLRNIPGARVMTAQDVNAFEVLRHRTLILTARSLELLAERLGTVPTGDATDAQAGAEGQE